MPGRFPASAGASRVACLASLQVNNIARGFEERPQHLVDLHVDRAGIAIVAPALIDRTDHGLPCELRGTRYKVWSQLFRVRPHPDLATCLLHLRRHDVAQDDEALHPITSHSWPPEIDALVFIEQYAKARPVEGLDDRCPTPGPSFAPFPYHPAGRHHQDRLDLVIC